MTPIILAQHRSDVWEYTAYQLCVKWAYTSVYGVQCPGQWYNDYARKSACLYGDEPFLVSF